MKKTLLTAASAIAILAFASNASARDGFYIGVKGGMSNSNLNSVDDSAVDDAMFDFEYEWFYSGAIGYRYKFFRIEAEYTHRNDFSNFIDLGGGFGYGGELQSKSYMANLYLDFMPNYVVSPYIMGGLGMSDLELIYKATGLNDGTSSDTGFTWSLGAGLTVRINKCLNLDLGYRYLDMGEVPLIVNGIDTGDIDINAHETYMGLRYTF